MKAAAASRRTRVTVRRSEAQDGQSMVEFALVSVTLLLFLVGTVDLGRAIYYYDVLANAARDGARRASVTAGADWQVAGNQPGTYTSALPYLGSATVVGATAAPSYGLDPSSLQVIISAPMGTLTGFSLPVTVATSYIYQPFAASLLGIGAITITSSSTMLIH